MKCVLVTGGSRGIGSAICKKLAVESDYHILINYHSNQTAAEETLQEIQKLGATGEILGFDVSNFEQVQNVLTQWQEANPEKLVEAIVNNAGITKDGLFMWMTPEDWNGVLNTSVNGFFNVTQFFIQKMLRNKYGRIVNMVSVSGVKGTAGQTNYSAAKGAIVAATKALAQEVAKRNITVNAVAPGFIRTDMTSELDEKELLKLIPVNRFGEAEEVADLVSFLISKKASYITGEIININGGIYS
ncbi:MULTISPECIES: 3-oxoacyl-ACP reductase FabG [unclassified Flavobacterium]|jgi:3-oxoacyl-[acyl-carrier protein] reductase|uniref:3-oxoacyl-ACP reductase FabG n=1 Tax=unclassified Flavobacterium TaxID=196869 RepID=UPI000710AE10|nr:MULTISPECIES: 3-oxoacyl-ACP reductase FabG [unclassified Flavobacterium]KRD62957.1 3-ketoacyl-ACP reductase [Flavobacterium sp. Root935]MDQ1168170.1 3-oxoacyl-[acyl-carrier protein] reductase [Flavobacterium sp. SORGH_AS_0622]TDX13578.1 3-oxoacyl-[acyl-carrier protein] reductase [Flavobacterium sp. S87F.05.LMB.W.Kidney.N]BDU24230.1 3-ketoacyl-ACP reductase [Flavobacterium sp. GSB-24]